MSKLRSLLHDPIDWIVGKDNYRVKRK